MSKKVAVLLSGCGVYDGAEIYETVLTLLRLDEQGVKYQCIAPDIAQKEVVNHQTGEVDADAKRSVLQEAARLARGDILALDQAQEEDFDALILPGGFGVAKNFSDFATQGAQASVEPQVKAFTQAFVRAKKPIGLMCIAPALSAELIGPGVVCTIGRDAGVSGALTEMGALHKSADADEIVVDQQHLLVTTPAYMMATRLSEAKVGIFKLVDKVIELIK
ncbi:isoprenoid biosynthesis glyoxalase ElbB [Marinospirillum sp.]|uniref:isoprenoid biosynthesis glyoxalase ElbB n=1 Tax=Marinospirillum sp. TaxID=2183934 RepID=UPI003A87B819